MDCSEIGKNTVSSKLNQVKSLRVTPETFSNPDLFFGNIPAQTGTYCLLIHLHKNLESPVGALGNVYFRKGYYCYVGSAFGSGGLKARIKRHLNPAKRIHWHIDYLLAYKNPEVVIFQTGNEKNECAWIGKLEKVIDARHMIKRFGSTDCQKCISHLVWFARMDEIYLRNHLGAHSH